ncbi:DNA polymerase III subunit epsilon [Gordonia hirsuta DSM 44140 = NBRC 16056]|uniref:DNA polymerase III subunit epsilon n=1 Tax=Gordonia hirsuta DSM 44140 = NBRC 16056 TaxID=1121927 RepID=L7L3W6_9ACTN|nr:DEDD exonuclease domain-containing protein [Gordonia hirsuta]GAC55840.1 DNA polymerase III subunit epsilon [Gordonia hirsuta DSM 44140 = NBRC 16056]
MATRTDLDAQQLSFADLPDDEAFATDALFDTTLVVVDLETTGGSAQQDAITEIGAVKIRGGQVLGEFATLVDPGRPIPPQIVSLTGITTAMVHDAPRIEEVLPAFFEFARGAILVAHNARFDLGFLRRAAERQQLAWPFPAHLCTVVMARRILSQQEAPTVKLSALAELFDVAVKPTHRALDDARATVDVFHRLLERVGNQGVHTYRELTQYLPRASAAQRAKRSLADGLPHRPGVYLFRGPGDEVLYIGTAVDLHRRVSGYFNGSDTRTRMAEMVALAARVEHIECAHALEAGVRELTLLAVHKPGYNRRSRNAQAGWWIVLTTERFPRLKVSRTPGPVSVGPVRNRAVAADIADVLSGAAGLRTCTGLPAGADHHYCPGESTAAALPDPLVAAVPGVCRAASDRPQTLPDYLPRVQAVHDLILGRSARLLDALTTRLTALVQARRFESAARARDRLAATIEALANCQRLAAIAALEELVLARPGVDGGWELAVIRHGRLAGAGVAVRGAAPMAVVDVVIAGAQSIPAPSPASGPLAGAPAEELGLIARWIDEPGTRLVACSGELSTPTGTALWRLDFAETARAARETAAATDVRLGA